MDNAQHYQPLSAAIVPPNRSPYYPPYGTHSYPSATNGTAQQNHREEEEEEEDDDEVEEELDNNERDHHQSASSHSSPRTAAAHPPGKSTGNTLNPAHASNPYANQPSSAGNDSSQAQNEDSKRKPGRPRGSRNRKPRAPAGTATKAPANTQHPGFYQYPPAPGGGITQNQQFYEFQWRALNLCSEFYNAAEELVKAASPLVIAQCYQMGPSVKIDPLAMISDAKRVCDSLLANPSQLVGNPPPAVYQSVPSYPMGPPPPPGPAQSTSGPSNSNAPVITNPQSFVMSLGTPSMPPPGHGQAYYPPMYATPGPRYPTAPYYSYQPQPSYYAQATQPPPPAASPTATSAPPVPAPAPAPAPAPTAPTTGTLSTFNAATGNIAPGGQQGTWSEEETERLRKLAEQSRDMGGAQTKGEIEWDWVIQQWGNTRTRHQILLKATSMGLKESTTRGTKRRRDNDSAPAESTAHPAPTSHAPPPPSNPGPPPAASPIHSPATHSPPEASPAMQSLRINSSTPTTIAPARTTSSSSSSNLPWPMPTVAANTPSPVMAHSTPDAQRSNYYRPRPPTQTSSYGAGPPPGATASPRPPSSHGNTGNPVASHPFMYRPNGSTNTTTGRRENGFMGR